MNDRGSLELALGPGTPPGVAASLRSVPGVRIRDNVAQPYVRRGDHRWHLRLLSRPDLATDPDLTAMKVLLETRPNRDRVVPMVLATSLPRTLRATLAKGGISYADARGNVHLEAPGLLLHVDAPPRSAKPPDVGRTSGLGLIGIRAVQVLADMPDRAWTVADLAATADVSAGQAHKTLATLEREGLVESSGRGPSKRRRLRDLGALLDWLAGQPRARRVYHQLTCSLYARTPNDLARRITRALDATGMSHACTAGLAAALLGAGPTSVPRAIVRIDPDYPLDQVADTLGAEITDRGANLVLWSDDGRVGTHGRTQRDDTWLAPPVRVYLDLLADRRGADAAAHFREVILGS